MKIDVSDTLSSHILADLVTAQEGLRLYVLQGIGRYDASARLRTDISIYRTDGKKLHVMQLVAATKPYGKEPGKKGS